MKIFEQKKLNLFVLLGLFLCAFAFMIPTNVAGAQASSVSDNYTAFDSSLRAMYKTFDNWENDVELQENEYIIENDEVYVHEDVIELYGLQKNAEKYSGGYFALSSDEVKSEGGKVVIENTPQNNRLLIYSEEEVSSFGAAMTAEYEDLHIFQYTSWDEAQNAYQHFSSLDYDVSYDNIVSVDGEVVGDTVYTYNSWGAEYVGYGDYTETMLKLNKQSNLPEVVVAVLDSGINLSHELFAGRIVTEYAKNYTAEGAETDVTDNKGHGTHVSGTIAEATLSNVKILPLKVLNKEGKGTVSMIVNALTDLRKVKSNLPSIKLVNMSIGLEVKDGSATNTTLMNAVRSVHTSGILPVVSAGNEQTETANACPANVTEAITVSALKVVQLFPSGKEVLRFDDSYSNYGKHVDFSAPGTYITSAGISASNAYVPMSGTSMAAPHVTAAFALIYSNPEYNSYTLDQTLELLKNNAYDLGTTGWDDYYGWGCINIKNIGIQNYGYVTFSDTNKFHENSFQLSLSYDMTGVEGTYKIYYTTDDSATIADDGDTLFQNAITISKTTKVTAVAYVYDTRGSLIRMSYATSHVYYYNNIDISSHFVLENDGSSGAKILTKYIGELTTLNLQSYIKSGYVTKIGESAFVDSCVEILYLPSTITAIGDYAFSKNTNLKEIYCSSRDISVGDYAFYMCTNLSIYDIEYTTDVGAYGFAYCSSLTELFLPNISTVGRHAISVSGVKEILLGASLEELGEQKAGTLSLIKIYGYASTDAKTLAKLHDVEFYDLTLRVEEKFSTKIVQKQEESLVLEFKVVGLYAGYGVYIDDEFLQNPVLEESSKEFDISEKITEISAKVTLDQLSEGSHTYVVKAVDAYNYVVSSKTAKLTILGNSVETVDVTVSGLNYNIYIDGELYDTTTKLYQGLAYTVNIQAKSGYDLKSVQINGKEQDLNRDFVMTGDEAVLNISAQVTPREKLDVSFNLGDCGDVFVKESSGDVALNTKKCAVARGDTLCFKIVQKEGYIIDSIYVNGQVVTAVDGYITLENISEDVTISVEYEEVFCTVSFVWGIGGEVESVSASGGIETDIPYGASRTYTISPEEGYEVDYVTVNGEKVEVVNNAFEVSEIKSESCEIVVMFKKTSSSLLSGDVLTYFWIFLIIFIVFVFAKILLYVIRKQKDKVGY